MNRRTIRSAAALAAGAALALGAAVATSAPAGAAAYGSSAYKVVGPDFPDPGFGKFTTRAQGTRYYLYATGTGFRVARSASPRSGYTKLGNTMNVRPAWVASSSSHLWAPHVFQTSTTPGAERFTMYFTGKQASTGRDCIGVATSSSPTGPFAPASAPLVCPPSGYSEAIDPSEYVTRYGNRYLIYKIGHYGPNRFQIMAMRVDNNRGTSRAGAPRTVLTTAQIGTAVAEAPDLVRLPNGTVWLFVSRNGYKDCNYATQVWSGSDLFALHSRGYVRGMSTSTTDRFCGPGGAEVIKDGTGYRISFHTRASISPLQRPAWVGNLGFDSVGAYLS